MIQGHELISYFMLIPNDLGLNLWISFASVEIWGRKGFDGLKGFAYWWW